MELTKQAQVQGLDPRSRFCISGKTTIADGESSGYIKLAIPRDTNFHTLMTSVSVIAADGKVLDKQEVRDAFSVEIKNESGVGYSNRPFDLYSLNEIANNPVYKGEFLYAKEERHYKIERLSTSVNPGAVSIEIIMHGHNVPKQEE